MATASRMPPPEAPRRMPWRLVRRAGPAAAIVPASPAAEREPEPARDETAEHAARLAEFCTLLEADLDAAVANVAEDSAAARQAGQAAAQEAAGMVRASDHARQVVQGASEGTMAVAAAVAELTAACRGMADQAGHSADATGRVIAAAEQAAMAVSALEAAVREIGAFTATIATIAAQTNLLALNATIEAARAGEAGKGFAVVAGEVKALSGQTRSATDDVANRIREVNAAAAGTSQAISAIVEAARGIGDASTAMAGAVDRQNAGLQDINRRTEAAAARIAEAAGLVADVTRDAERLGTLANEAADATVRADGRVGELRSGIVISLRNSALGNRRRESRVPVVMPGVLRHAGGGEAAGMVLDLSPGGAVLRLAAATPGWVAEGAALRLSAGRLPALGARVVGLDGTAVHLQFDSKQPDSAQGQLQQFLDRVVADDGRFIAAATEAARRIEAAMESALSRGEITESALFDADYQPVPGSNPRQVTTGFVTLTDRLLPPIQEPLLGFDPRVVFCAAVDRNGYLPTHNNAWSQPQRPDDPAWNAAHSRNRRIFNDRAGLAAARNARPHLLQSYERDMGGGQRVPMKEADVPIRVRGRHWGALRLAFRPGESQG